MIAIVTGASSGIGYEVSAQLLAAGYTVYGISRREKAPEGVTALCADVSDEAAVRACVDEVARREGRIDLLCANAGMGISGPVEFASPEATRKIMNVNFFGQVYAAQAVLPYMRAQESGTIVFTSSVAAPIAIPYQAFYSASKSAINSIALALRNEVREYGIRVSVVMPGDSSTGFTDAREKLHGNDSATNAATAGTTNTIARSSSPVAAGTVATAANASAGTASGSASPVAADTATTATNASAGTAYPRCDAAVASMERDERGGIPPAKVAAVIVKAARKKNPAPLYVAGFKYRLLLGLYNLLPARTAVWLVGKFY